MKEDWGNILLDCVDGKFFMVPVWNLVPVWNYAFRSPT